MTEQIDVSVIIPVYNCEQYVDNAIKSVLAEEGIDLEVICVDDGSIDSSVDIIDKLKQSDNRIRLLRQENKGSGSARNYGIAEAKGEYIAFLDADDYYIDRDALKRMMDNCRRNHTLVCGAKMMKNINGMNYPGVWNYRSAIAINFDDSVYNYKDIQILPHHCSFLYKKDFLIKNKISYPDYRRCQDSVFIVSVLCAAETISFENTELLSYTIPNYSQHVDSLEKSYDAICALYDICLFADSHNLEHLFNGVVDIICRDGAIGITRTVDLKIIEKLIQTNNLVVSRRKDDSFCLSPLKDLLNYYHEGTRNYIEQTAVKIGEYNEFYVFGLGRIGKAFLNYLDKKGSIKKVKNIIVSSLVDNDSEYLSVKVKEVLSLSKDSQSFDIPVIIAVYGSYQADILRMLEKYGYKNVICLKSCFLESLDS